MAENPTLRHEGSYVTIHPGPVARTVQIRPDLHVDLAADGRVIGVERIGAPVTAQDLAAVLFVLPLPFPPAEPTDADVELVARALADLAFGPEDDHAPWHYTEFGTACTCGAAIVGDDRCTANWDHMPDEGKDNYRTAARAVLSALVTAGRLLPPGGETR